MLNGLVDKIVVRTPDKSNGKRKQKIEIYYRAADVIDIAGDECIAEDGRQNRWLKRTHLNTQKGGTAGSPRSYQK